MVISELTDSDYAYRFPDHWLLHELHRGELFERLNAYYVARIVEILKQHKVRKVLEVGCGDGWACSKMADAAIDTVGVDWSENAIKYASMFVPKAKFMRADVRDRAFIDQFANHFDGVAFIEVLEHIPPKDCVDVLRNIARPLKSGGILLVTTPSENFANDNPQHYQHFTEPKLRELVSAAGGLKIESIEGYGDVVAERKHYRTRRWIDNQYIAIKPAVRLLEAHYHRTTKLKRTPLDRCHGLIMSLIKR